MMKSRLYTLPTDTGHFGPYGGRFIPETLMEAVIELNLAYEEAKNDESFLKEYQYFLREYVGRENPLYYAENLTNHLGGAKIF